MMRLKIPVVMKKNGGDGSLFPVVLMNDSLVFAFCYVVSAFGFLCGYRKQLILIKFHGS